MLSLISYCILLLSCLFLRFDITLIDQVLRCLLQFVDLGVRAGFLLNHLCCHLLLLSFVDHLLPSHVSLLLLDLDLSLFDLLVSVDGGGLLDLFD